jgi:hypothetical protein
MPNEFDDRSLIEAVKLVREIGIAASLKKLTIAQTWGALAAIGAVLTAVGGLLWGLILPPDLVPCYKAEGYPRGEWLASGRATDFTGQRPGIEKFITFLSDTDGTVDTDVLSSDNPPKRLPQGKFTVNPKLDAGSETTMVQTVEKKYSAKATLHVSDDGCVISGLFEDTNGNRVDARYFWFTRSQFWVRRKRTQR